MVRRSAKLGGALYAIGSIQFVLGMAVTQLLWHGSYSLTQNYVSDLGGPDSAAAWVFNDSIRVLGVIAVLASPLVYRAFVPRRSSQVGFALLVIAGLGAAAVGTFPEESPQLGGNIHGIVSLVTFLGSGLGLLVLSAAMLRDTRWEGYRLFTLLGGIVTLVALVLFVDALYPGLGPGGMERVVVAPVLLWGPVVGVHLLRLPTYRPEVSASGDYASC